MKRALIREILSAGLVAAGLAARCSAQVYSQSVGSFFGPVTNNSQSYWSSVSEYHGIITSPGNVRSSSTVWQKGAFAIGESRTWTNVAVLYGDLPPGDPASSSTSFAFAAHSVTVPFSLKRMAIVGEIALLGLGGILSGVLAKKCFKSAGR
jgi:hypothetical protein